MTTKAILQSKKDFDNLIADKDKYLALLLRHINKQKLIYDDIEAEAVSNFLIENKDMIKSVDLLKSLVIYYGEFIINNFGGEWYFTGGKDDFNPNEAAIGNSIAILLRACPTYYINEILRRKDSLFFVNEINNDLKSKKEIKNLMKELFPKKKK